MSQIKLPSLTVVGLGPGDPTLLTPQASQALTQAQVIVGYPRYVELLDASLRLKKTILTTSMRQEKERCHLAIDAALKGQPTCLLASGDPGIYALAGLTIELLEQRALLDSINLTIIPGVPALCAAAALLGAPLSHDFACVSLSDLLTPWSQIQKRLIAALACDFVLVLYNPRSKGRPDYLKYALDLASQYREPTCPIGLVRQAYRSKQTVINSTLQDFDVTQVDMLSIVILGNTQSRKVGEFLVTPRGYHLT
ncbi:MAG: precorrin-3B C(17)-methyltransferase [Desulfovibrionaceae bacterium]|nr:precorrin-3B C(17)-methyltransferase [Desulfovibrionaceae bacterium]